MARHSKPPKLGKNRTTVGTAITVPPGLLIWARDYAKGKHQTLSALIASLMEEEQRKVGHTERPAAKEPAAEPEKKGEIITPSASGARKKLSPKSQPGAKKDRTNPPGQKNEPTNPP